MKPIAIIVIAVVSLLVASCPDNRSASVPSFISVGKSYTFVWPEGSVGSADRTVVATVEEIGGAGWIKIKRPDGGILWINLALIQGIRE